MALSNECNLGKCKLGIIARVNSKIVPKMVDEEGSVQIHQVASNNLRTTGFLSAICTQD